MTIAQKLLALAAIKTALRDAINGKGGELDVDSAFAAYAAAVAALPDGGGATVEWVAGQKPDPLSHFIVRFSGTELPASTFANNVAAASLEFDTPNLTSIGNSVFQNWTSATSLVIPGSVTSIGSNCFFGWTSATYLVIPDSVTSIGAQAFVNWTSAQTVDVLREAPAAIPVNAFTNLPASAQIRVPSESVDAYKAAPGWSVHASKIVALP